MKIGMNETTAAESVAAMASRLATSGGTDNQKAFAAWLADVSEYNFTTPAEQKAFEAGAMLGINAYKRWQAAKPTSANYVAPLGAKAGKPELERQTTDARARAKAATDRAAARAGDGGADVAQEAVKAAPGRVSKPRPRKPRTTKAGTAA